MKARVFISVTALSLTALVSNVFAYGGSNCTGSDCLGSLGNPSLNIATEADCTQVGTEAAPIAPAGLDSPWGQGLSTEVDHAVIGCDIPAYKIQWFNGTWSDWFVTGVNDINWKYDPRNGKLVRAWGYFGDHNHLYIKCCEQAKDTDADSIADTDTDADGIADANDKCPDTASGDAVDASGCSVAQLCPCNKKGHSAYVQCVNKKAKEFYQAGLVSKKEYYSAVKKASFSRCGLY